MSKRSVNAAIDGDNSECSILSTGLSGRGSTKHDAISVENYDRVRHLHLWSRSKIPIHIDLDDDLSLTPVPKSLDKGEFECEICVEHKPIIESFGISGCSHSYCNDCVSKYIAAKLQDNILSIGCPVSGCSGRLEPYQCREILPGEVFDRWGDALCEALVMHSKRFYCPYKDCSALVFREEKMRESECPHCHRMVCVECGTKWHPEITCDAFQKLGENERERDDILLKNMAESLKWKRCPSCKFYVEKSKGCSFMRCRCGTAFCYNCGSLFRRQWPCRCLRYTTF